VTKRILALSVVAAALVALTPLAITTSAAEMNCRVPFAFTANGSTLPAGAYSIATSNGYVLLRGLHKAAFIPTTPTSGAADRSGLGKVVFLRTGDRYDLIEIRSSDGSGSQVSFSRRQLEERARATEMPERIEISTK
jgi:hypothetical protein